MMARRWRSAPVTLGLAWLLCAIGPAQAQRAQTGVLLALGHYDEPAWRQLPSPPFAQVAMAGDPRNGVLVFGGVGSRQGAVLHDVRVGKWEVIAEAPFVVKRCAGDVVYGPIISGGEDDRQLAIMRSFKVNKWEELPPAPLPVVDVAGDNNFGVIVVGGENRAKVAYMRRYAEGRWNLVADAPFAVTAVAGENNFGIIVTGGKEGRQVAIMTNYAENRWTPVADAPFALVDLAGNNEYGPAGLGGRGNRQVAFMQKYAENRWRVVAELPEPATHLSGANNLGIIAASIGPGPVKVVTRQVYKTAVVEFTERGELGIPEAGAIIAEWLTTALNKTGAFEVYERLSLDRLMEEHKLGMSGLLDEATIAEIGRLRGVQAIVTGSVSKFGDIVSVTARVMDVTTAKIISTGDIKVKDVNAISGEIDRLAWELAK